MAAGLHSGTENGKHAGTRAAMYFAETAETAAVRISVMRRQSISAISPRFSGSSSRMLARWVGRPRARLAPMTATSLAPSTGGSRTNPGMTAKKAASPISTTGRTGCTTWPDENAASAVSMARIKSGMGSTARISASLRHSVNMGQWSGVVPAGRLPYPKIDHPGFGGVGAEVIAGFGEWREGGWSRFLVPSLDYDAVRMRFTR